MVAVHGTRLAAFAASALALVLACSSRAEDGASCSKDAACSSGRCLAGSCDGSDCTCEGADCRSPSSCLAGWLCTRGEASTDDAIPRCRRACAGAGSCPSAEHCDGEICRPGPEPFVLTWVNIPRAQACAPQVPCAYEVRATDPSIVDTYTWTFGDAAPIQTKEPKTSFTYTADGTFDVVVSARANTGATAELHTTEVLCAGGVGAACDPLGAPCCEGSCNATSLCK